jgi:hypothetical protein
MAGHREIVVTVSPTHHGKIDGVAKELEAAGMSSTQVMKEIGIVTGAAPANVSLDRLRAVDGVSHVEEGETYHTQSPGGGAY